MPRARIPNARFLADADSPILPFLAPRIFIESPIPERKLRHNGERGYTQKEKEKEKEKVYDIADGHMVKQVGHNGEQERHWIQCPGYGSSFTRENHAANLLSTQSPARSRPGSGRCSSLPNSVGLRYADISSFARTQFRSYATAESDKPVGEVTPKMSHRSYRRNNQGRSNRDMVRTVSQEPGLLALRRKRALQVEQKRMETLLLHALIASKSLLARDGRYRSLQRRLFNLSRTKGTLVDMSLGSKEWERRPRLIRPFAALDRSLYPRLKRKTAELELKHDLQCVVWTAKLFENAIGNEEEQVWENWTQFDEATQKKCWQPLILYLLDRMPGRAQVFLQALARSPNSKFLKAEVLADALGHLAQYHARQARLIHVRRGEETASSKVRFAPVFFQIFHAYLAKHRFICSQDLLYNIATTAEIEDLKRLWAALEEANAFLGFDTMLHYAHRFGDAGEYQHALSCLKAVRRKLPWEAVVNRKRFRWSCAHILRNSMSKQQNYHETTNIVAEFVNLGVKLDVLLYNVIMHNAMEAGDYGTAFKVYNSLEENGLKPDERTFSILLHGCTLQSDPARFDDFAEYSAQTAKTLKNSWLATNYLNYLYVRHHKDGKKPEQVLGILAKAYSQFFSTDPLEPLLFQTSRALYHTSLNNSATKPISLNPPPAALYIMLQAEIQQALNRSSHHVWELYMKFRRLVQQRHHPVLDKLSRDPVIWNAFLLAFCRKQQFASASQLIKDMTDGSPQPNIYTWNIFMQAFFKTGQVQAAERVFQILRSRGVDPDQYTYGVMLRGYARAQHVEKIGEIMQHVDSEHQLDPQLLQALARVHKRQRLMFMLERARLKKEQQHKIEAARAEEQRRIWKTPQSPSGKQEQSPKFQFLVQSTEQVVTSEALSQYAYPTFKRVSIELDDSNSKRDLPKENNMLISASQEHPSVNAQLEHESVLSPERPLPHVRTSTDGFLESREIEMQTPKAAAPDETVPSSPISQGEEEQPILQSSTGQLTPRKTEETNGVPHPIFNDFGYKLLSFENGKLRQPRTVRKIRPRSKPSGLTAAHKSSPGQGIKTVRSPFGYPATRGIPRTVHLHEGPTKSADQRGKELKSELRSLEANMANKQDLDRVQLQKALKEKKRGGRGW